MKIKNRLLYFKRVMDTYTKRDSNVYFWHTNLGIAAINNYNVMDEYYMDFTCKLHYEGPYDEDGVPTLNYKGNIGVRYNIVAIAQYALGAYNKYINTKDDKYKDIFLNQADWFVKNNDKGGWNYDFDWNGSVEPYISGLSQFQAISVLLRAHKLTSNLKYLDVAKEAYNRSMKMVEDGGTVFVDNNGYYWIEEHPNVSVMTHILNGFIWALWGVYDYYIYLNDDNSLLMYNKFIDTLKNNLHKFDASIWSLYDLSNNKIKMVCSKYYHNLHIVQLRILYNISKEKVFNEYALKWEKYSNNIIYRNIALIWKVIFKVFYY